MVELKQRLGSLREFEWVIDPAKEDREAGRALRHDRAETTA